MKNKLYLLLLSVCLSSFSIGQKFEIHYPLSHIGIIQSASWSNDGKLIVTCSSDRTIKVWNSENGEIIHNIQGIHDIPTKAWMSTDNNYIKYEDIKGGISFIDLKTEKIETYAFNNDFQKSGYFYHVSNNTFIVENQTAFKFSPSRKRKVKWMSNFKSIEIQSSNNSLLSKFKNSQEITNAFWSPDETKLIITNSKLGDANFEPYVISASNGKIILTLKGQCSGGIELDANDITNRIVSGNTDGSVNVWNTEDLKLEHQFHDHSNTVLSAHWNKSGTKYVSTSLDGTMVIRDLKSSEIIQYNFGKKANIANFSNKGDLIVVTLGDYVDIDSKVYIFDIKSKQIIKTLAGHKSKVYEAKFIDNDTKIVSVSITGEAIIWDVIKEKKIKKIQAHFGAIYSLAINNFKPLFATGGRDGTVKVWNYRGDQIKNYSGENAWISYIHWSNNGSQITLNNSKGKSTTWEFDTDKKIQHVVTYPHVVFSNINGLMVTRKNASIKLWNTTNNKMEYEFISIGHKDYIIRNEDNYYLSTPNAAQSLKFKLNDQKYFFDQFDLVYNRPDILLKSKNEELSSLLYKAYLKRLRKNDIDIDLVNKNLTLGTINILNKENYSYNYSKENIVISLHVEDLKNQKTLIIWNNNVPRSIALSDQKSDTLNVQIELIDGENKLEFSSINNSGLESLREGINIFKQSISETKPNLYLISIGISQFNNQKFNLTYASKDAIDVESTLKKSMAFSNVYTKTLTNSEVTKNNILQLKNFLNPAQINDQIMIFIADHGVLDENLDYFFATYDMDFSNPKTNGIAYEEIEALLNDVKPLKKSLIIDACHSGEIDKEEVTLVENSATQLNNNITFRNVGNNITSKFESENSIEFMKSMFTDLRRGTGTTIISSAGGSEFAMESDQWKNGLFTYCMLNGIKSNQADLNKDGEVWLTELKQYVTQQVTHLSKGKQQPTSRRENQVMDHRIW